jgi:catechol 2,3-dioxygenase-like lactoylglutathione lyase family enzyme
MTNNHNTVECTIPILPVQNIAQSIEFYTNTLGFTLDWGGQPGSTICSVSRDGHSLMLAHNFGCGSPAWVWIGLEDAALFDEFRTKGVKVLQEPRNFSWAYEMKFADPDENVLWLGTEPRTDLPLEDEK